MRPPYYAEGRSVYKRPVFSGDGTASMGFRVCDLADGVSDDGAEEIAAALNRAEMLKGQERG